MKIKYGTRGSKLAVLQTRQTVEILKKTLPEVEFEEHIIKTLGDKVTDMPLFKVGGQGLFIKEIETELLEKRIDIAVHSLKDMPHEMSEGLCLLAVGLEEDPRDCLISIKYSSYKEIPAGAVIGTSSLRRRAQLALLREDLIFSDYRGNLDTRLKKLEDGEADAIVIAAAGLKRMQLENKVREYFSVNEIIPPAGQGLLAIQCRTDDKERFFPLIKNFASESAMIRTRAEREFLRILQGGCKTPMAAHAQVTGDKIILQTFFADDSGKNTIKNIHTGAVEKPEELGEEAAREILAAKEILCTNRMSF